MRGVCQWFDKKHGFIKPDGGGADIFVHQMDLRAGTEITQGDAVEFGTADYNGRDKAVDVTKVERQFSHDGPAGRGRGGFGDARSAAAPGDGGGHRGPAPPHAFPPRGFGPTRLSEAVSRRLHADALHALAQLETADADAVVQRLTQKGAEVRNPSAFVCQAVKTILGARRDGFARPGVVPPLPDGANPRKVRVKNITYTASESEIKAFFAAVGEVTDVQICKDQCFITFASAEAANRAIATMNNAEFQGRKLRVGWPVFDRCRGGFAGADIARHCADGRSAGDGGGHRESRGPVPPHALHRSVQRPPRGFGPTRLSEAMSRRLRPDALRALAELETGDADAVVQRLEEAGLTVRDPSGYVMKAVERVRRGGTAGWNGAVGRFATCGAQGHLARDCPSAARGAPLDSLASLPSPTSARDNWICGACGGDNFARRRECFRCGTVNPGGSTFEQKKYGSQVPPRRRSRSRSRERERRRRRSRGSDRR